MRTKEEYLYQSCLERYKLGFKEWSFSPEVAEWISWLPSYEDGYVYFLSQEELESDFAPSPDTECKRLKINIKNVLQTPVS